MQLFGNRVLITGGGRGIGRAISLALAQLGADVVITYRSNHDAAQKTVQELQERGCRAHAIHGDLANLDAPANMLHQAANVLGGLDIVVCNAGMHHRTPFLEISVTEWDEVVHADLRGPFLLSQAAARLMIEQGGGGRIVMIDSISADVAYPNLTHYQAAKAGLRMLARGMALELAPHRITVNTVAPGVVATDLNVATRTEPVQRDYRLGKIPLGRFGEPNDIAAAVAFIASDQTNWMTGSTITVDGGQTVQ